jgi:hypothetical protein
MGLGPICNRAIWLQNSNGGVLLYLPMTVSPESMFPQTQIEHVARLEYLIIPAQEVIEIESPQ